MELERIRRSPAVPRPPGLLFVHGAFHGASCWDEHFLPCFADAGHDATALSLRGHGAASAPSEFEGAGLDDYLEDVLSVLDDLPAPVVIVGHSMGGVLAERVFASRADVAGMVLLACSPLRPAASVALRLLLRRPGAVLRGLLGKDPEALRPAFAEFSYSEDLSAAVRQRHEDALVGESQRAIDEVFSRAPLERAAGDGRPALVVAGQGDWSIPAASHERLAAAWAAPLVWCPGAHDLMVDAPWREAATAILDWLAREFADAS